MTEIIKVTDSPKHIQRMVKMAQPMKQAHVNLSLYIQLDKRVYELKGDELIPTKRHLIHSPCMFLN